MIFQSTSSLDLQQLAGTIAEQGQQALRPVIPRIFVSSSRRKVGPERNGPLAQALSGWLRSRLRIWLQSRRPKEQLASEPARAFGSFSDGSTSTFAVSVLLELISNQYVLSLWSVCLSTMQVCDHIWFIFILSPKLKQKMKGIPD